MESRRTRRNNPLDSESARSRQSAKVSPARKSPVARKKSPSRKSPARKSPARKSPARKTSTRSKASAAKKKPDAPAAAEMKSIEETNISPANTGAKSVLKLSISPYDNKTSQVDTKTTKTTSTTTATRVKVENLSTNKNSDSIDLAKVAASYREAIQAKLQRLSQRLTPTPSGSRRTDSRSISRSIIEDDDERRSRSEEYSDNEKEPEYKSFEKYKPELTNSYIHRPEIRKFLNKPEFGGNIGAFILILLWSLVGFYIQFICTRKSCQCNMDRAQKLKSLNTYMNMEAGVLYIGYTWGIIILSAIPIGSIVRISDHDNSTYTFNGLLSAISAVIAIIVAEHFGYSALKMITSNYQRLLSISLVNAIVLSGWLYIRSNYVPLFRQNPYARNGKFLSDFFIGKEINPKWLDIVNVKLVLYRMAIVATLIFNGIFIYKNLKFTPLPADISVNVTLYDKLTAISLHTYDTIVFDPVALLIAGLLVVYALDLLIFESHLVNSFEIQSEGVGACLLIRYALYPHLTSLIAKYTLEHTIKGMPNWALGLIGGLFLFGLCLKRGSNRVKHQFRLNPVNPKFSSKPF